jgi:hypothetical protein
VVADAPEFKPMSFSASVMRDGIFPAWGLMPKEIAFDVTKQKVKPPAELADKKAELDEMNFGIGIHPRIWLRGYSTKSMIQGSTRRWWVEGQELNLGIKLTSPENLSNATSLEIGRRVIEVGPIYKYATNVADMRFLEDAYLDNAKITRTILRGENNSIHLMGGFSRAKYSTITKNSKFVGFGWDRIIHHRVDWQNSLIFIDSEDRPKNTYLSSRFNIRVAKGLNISLAGSMYTNGYSLAPLRFVDHFVPAMAVPSSRLPSSVTKFETKAFGFYGIGIHYGFSF